MPRLFVALRPPPAIREDLLSLQGGVPGARWQDEEQLHLTVRFIGDVEGPVADDVAAALGSVHASAPTARLFGVGAFRHRDRTEAIWAGVQPADPLRALHAKVDQACARAGLERERRSYLPHITLARFSRSAGGDPAIERWLAERAGLSGPSFPMMHLILYQSVLGRDGARYEAIARWPLTD
ncbi:2'-5' RNA ligase [Sphingomonas gellani]|uniref:RNA 2',3'-cyclic phosphodiesterase n=1 Tax=Sphingomonas gellani TaxID=1166340 RepID=A0A1H8EHA2_9SPHN|nr:RNA 2',3'-cyclic phosphodiesterase [Sphingomonas gellani]SEN18504.1 2'-5' RNA ligase [Sphingomonas gellani]